MVIRREEKKPQGRPRKYAWDTLLESGNSFVFHKGTDYKCTTSSIAAQIRSAASNKGVSVRIVVAEDEKSLTVRVDPSLKRQLNRATN